MLHSQGTRWVHVLLHTVPNLISFALRIWVASRIIISLHLCWNDLLYSADLHLDHHEPDHHHWAVHDLLSDLLLPVEQKQQKSKLKWKTLECTVAFHLIMQHSNKSRDQRLNMANIKQCLQRINNKYMCVKGYLHFLLLHDESLVLSSQYCLKLCDKIQDTNL